MRIVEVSFPANVNPLDKEILHACEKILRQKSGSITSYEVLKKSLDARGGKISYKYRVAIATKGEEQVIPFKLDDFKDVSNATPVIIVGCGPAGLFSALKLIQLGFKPIILERGKNVHERKFDIAALSKKSIVNPNSNYCFGEGGAGTFSDGKLYTRSNKKGDIREVLHLFVKFGANPSILIDSHAHIGSDKLPRVVENMRNFIIEKGGEVHFNSFVADFYQKNNLWNVKVLNPDNTSEQLKFYTAKNIILATGHSARDIYEIFDKNKWEIEAKGFALGVRVEHPQSLINNIQYHGKFQPYLPAAEYSLVTQVDGRGVFSFCMCPGGILVPAATSAGELVLNGMSNSMRNSKWANAGIVVQVNVDDISGRGCVLDLLDFQRSVEKKIFEYGDGTLKAPAQRMNDFVKGKLSENLPETSYVPGVYSAPLHELLPPFVAKAMQKAFLEFNKKMKGYYTEKALLIAVESRTSSPVRIVRDKESLQHVSLENLYPCGEGSGYSGGIVSSALDGINVAKAITKTDG